MADINFGTITDRLNFNFGSTQVQKVDQGGTTVWQNNQAPGIDVTGPIVGTPGADNTDISVGVSSTQLVTFNYSDTDAADTVSTISVTDPNGASLTVSGFTAGLNSGSANFTIPNNLFTVYGPVTSNNVFTITATDNRGGVGTTTVTVVSATFAGPSISGGGTQSLQALTSQGAQTATFNFTITQSATAISAGATIEYSTDGGSTWTGGGNGPTTVTRYASASCGGSGSTSLHTRSILSGTTATGSTGTGSVIVTAPNGTLPVTVNGAPGGYYYQVSNNSFSRNCAGDYNGLGSGYTRSFYVRYSASSGYRYVGTIAPSVAITFDGTSTTLGGSLKVAGGNTSIQEYGTTNFPYTPPAGATGITVNVTGGDIEHVIISGPNMTRIGLVGGAYNSADVGNVGDTVTMSLQQTGSSSTPVGKSWYRLDSLVSASVSGAHSDPYYSVTTSPGYGASSASVNLLREHPSTSNTKNYIYYTIKYYNGTTTSGNVITGSYVGYIGIGP